MGGHDVSLVPKSSKPVKRVKANKAKAESIDTTWQYELRGRDFVEVPIDFFTAGGTKRARIPVLETWRGESFVYEQLPGVGRSISAVLLNRCGKRWGLLAIEDREALLALEDKARLLALKDKE